MELLSLCVLNVSEQDLTADFMRSCLSVMKSSVNPLYHRICSLLDNLPPDCPTRFTGNYSLFLILADNKFTMYNVPSSIISPLLSDSCEEYLEQIRMSLVTVKKKSVSVSNVDRAADIYSEHGEFILSVIRYHVGNNSKIDDLFQDFFLSLVCRPIPPDVRNIRGYLYRAITSEIINASRRVKSYQSCMEKYARNLNYSINKNTPESALIEIEEINKMLKLIEGQLPHSEAQAVKLRYKSNWSIREVAKEMCVNDRTVSRYISAGLSKFRQFLAEKRR